jgi:hypothetical protein
MVTKTEKTEDKPDKPKKETRIRITPINMQTQTFSFHNTAPLCLNRFGAGKLKKMADAMAKTEEKTKKDKAKKPKRPPRDYEQEFHEACHLSTEGWFGFPASGIRTACVDVCRVADAVMTKAKLSIFVVPDGYSADGTPLVKIYGEPKKSIKPAKNSDGSTDLRSRPLWMTWGMQPTIRWDADQFYLEDVVNLLVRVGIQVGLGEGRPFSKKSCGIGYGTFDLAEFEGLDVCTASWLGEEEAAA